MALIEKVWSCGPFVRWLVAGTILVQAGGCVASRPPRRTAVMEYQQQLAHRSPQPRVNMDGSAPGNPVGLLEPAATPDEPLPRLPTIGGELPDLIELPRGGKHRRRWHIELQHSAKQVDRASDVAESFGIDARRVE